MLIAVFCIFACSRPAHAYRTPNAATTEGVATYPEESSAADSLDLYDPNDPVAAKIVRYCQSLLDESDRDADRRLDRMEWGPMRGFLMTDSNRDGFVVLEEIIGRTVNYGRQRRIRLTPLTLQVDEELPPLLIPLTAVEEEEPAEGDELSEEEAAALESQKAAANRNARPRDLKYYVSDRRLPSGLPASFLSRDQDGDGQLTMAEFAPETTSAALAEFARYDTDGDGIITAVEFLLATKASRAAALKARKK